MSFFSHLPKVLRRFPKFLMQISRLHSVILTSRKQKCFDKQFRWKYYNFKKIVFIKKYFHRGIFLWKILF